MAAGSPVTLSNMASATTSKQGPVKQAAAQADTAGGATLADLITAHNALLAKLRTAGIMAT